MKKFIKTLILFIVAFSLIAGMLVFAGCSKSVEKFELKTPLDDSVPFLRGKDISLAQAGNGDRGFRHELYITLDDSSSWKNTRSYPTSTNTTSTHYAKETERLKADAPNVAQLYVYLCNYNTKDISAAAFEQLYGFLSQLKKDNIRVLIRFAYEYDEGNPAGPKTEVMLGHIAQIKEWLIQNKSSAAEAIMAYQAGFVGLWGEWHTSQYPHNLKKVLKAIVDMVPEGKFLQVRTMDIKQKLGIGYKSKKVGFHDDYLTGAYNEWNIVDHSKGKNKSDFNNFKKQSALTINDGEMPWGRANINATSEGFVKDIYEHKLSTLSLMHNYTEDGGSYNLDKFKSDFISEDVLKKWNVPYNPYWFIGSNGVAEPRTVFDYIDDHLGYQLVASNFKTQLKDETDSSGRQIRKGSLSFTVSNFGMAAPYTIDKIELYFRNPETGKVETKSSWLEGKWEAGKLTTFGQLSIDVPDVAFLKGWEIGVKIYSSSNRKNTIRLVNDVKFIDGVNYIYSDK